MALCNRWYHLQMLRPAYRLSATAPPENRVGARVLAEPVRRWRPINAVLEAGVPAEGRGARNGCAPTDPLVADPSELGHVCAGGVIPR